MTVSGDWWIAALLLAGLLLGVAGLVYALTWMRPRREEEAVTTRDEQLLADVTGLGMVREPHVDARADAARLDALNQAPEGGADLRGDRDLDPNAPNPWKA